MGNMMPTRGCVVRVGCVCDQTNKSLHFDLVFMSTCVQLLQMLCHCRMATMLCKLRSRKLIKQNMLYKTPVRFDQPLCTLPNTLYALSTTLSQKHNYSALFGFGAPLGGCRCAAPSWLGGCAKQCKHAHCNQACNALYHTQCCVMYMQVKECGVVIHEITHCPSSTHRRTLFLFLGWGCKVLWIVCQFLLSNVHRFWWWGYVMYEIYLCLYCQPSAPACTTLTMLHTLPIPCGSFVSCSACGF